MPSTARTALSYAAGVIIIVTAAAGAVVFASPGESKGRLIDDTSVSCGGEQVPVAWDRYELGQGGRELRVIYYDSGSIKPCSATYGEGALGVFTNNPSSYTLDLAPHCVTVEIPAGQTPPGLLRDSNDGKIHGISLGLYDEFGGPGHERCIPVPIVV